MMQRSVKRLCLDAMLLGAALMLSYLEAMLPLQLIVPLPGVRLGLANIAVMAAFFGIRRTDGAIISLCRISLCALLFGSITSFWFALSGAVFAYLGMLICDIFGRGKMSVISVSVLCAALHNTGQICACAIVLDSTSIAAYLPFLLICGMVTGTLCGICVRTVLPIMRRFYR